MKTAIIFDLDGTLLNTLEDITDATNYILTQNHCPTRTKDELRCFVGNGARRQMYLSLPGRWDDPDLDSVLSAYKAYYNTHCQIKTKPYDGIIPVLQELRKKYPIGIVSNKPDATVKQLCAHYFPGVYALGEQEGFLRKPAPDMVWQAMKELKAEKGIYVGDSEVDVETAKNAGTVCLSVLWGFRDQPVLEQAGAKYYCAKPENLVQMVEKIDSMFIKNEE